MRRNQLLIAGLIFVGLFFLTLWVLREQPAAPPDTYFTLKRRTPDTLLVVYGSDATTLVPRGETGWRVIAPVDYPADGLLVDTMIKTLTDLKIGNRYPMTPEKLDSYGLRSPRGLIRAAYGDGALPDTLFVGGFTPNGAFDYVRSGTHPEVALLDSRLTRTYLLKTTTELRETRLMPFSEIRARRLEILDGEDRVRFSVSRDEEGAWRFSEPFPGLGDAGEIGEYLASLSHMHIREFVPGGAAAWERYGLLNPRLGARVHSENDRETGFFLGRILPEEELVYARGLSDEQIFKVSSKYVPFLLSPEDQLRRPATVTFGLNQVDSVRVRVGEEQLTIPMETPGIRAEPTATRDVLGNWVLLKAEGFQPATAPRLRQWGLDSPEGQMTWMHGLDTLAVVDIGGERNGQVPIRIVSGWEARAEEILLLPSRQAIPLWSYLQRQVRGAAGN